MTPEQEVEKIISAIEARKNQFTNLTDLRDEVARKVDELYKAACELDIEVATELPEIMEVMNLDRSGKEKVVSSNCRFELKLTQSI